VRFWANAHSDFVFSYLFFFHKFVANASTWCKYALTHPHAMADIRDVLLRPENPVLTAGFSLLRRTPDCLLPNQRPALLWGDVTEGGSTSLWSGPVPSLGRFRHYIEFETQGEKEEDMAGWAEDFSPKSAPQVVEDKPTHEEIRLRAHQIYIERGGTHGQDIEDWLEAERQLLDERAKTRLKANAAVV
jgi:Protein of unknown function (DUF2934)